MKYTNEELKKYYKGAYSFRETEEGWLQAFQYSEKQMGYFRRTEIYWYERSFASSAKTIEAVTDATEISFDYKIIWQGSLDSFELCANGEIAETYYIENLEPEGRLTFHLPANGNIIQSAFETENSSAMNAPGNKIIIYLPIDATVLIRNLEADAELTPIEPRKKILWMGDSITQGYGPLRSAYTYVSVANRILNCDIINQGIGGYIYDKGSVMPMEGYRPDEIIVSLGTNQYASGNIKPVRDFYDRLTEVYGSEIPVTVITPVWRCDFFSKKQEDDFVRFCEEIKDLLADYPNVRIIDGFELLPHEPEFYIDGLHPNRKGAECYGQRLAGIISGLKFS